MRGSCPLCLSNTWRIVFFPSPFSLQKWTRRFFVLWQASQRGSCRIEYFNDEAAYRSHDSKRVILMSDCESVFQVHVNLLEHFT